MFKVGILMPRSTLYPTVGLDILAGIKEALTHHTIFTEITILTDNIGFATNEQEVYAKAEKMLLMDEVDMVVMIADLRITEMLQPLFAASNKVLLMVNMGTDIPENWNVGATTIIHSLNFCLNAKLTGALAAQQINKKTINTLWYYDAGYLQCFSMINGNQQKGGSAAFYHITPLKDKEFSLQPIQQFLIENNDVKTVLCLFSGIQIPLFYKEIAALQQSHQLHLFVSPMMLDESIKKEVTANFLTNVATGFVPWHSSLNNPTNSIFKNQLAQSGKATNYFSVLGWDTGTLIQKIKHQYQQGNTNAAQIVQSIAGQKIDSPRGWIKIDPSSNYVYAPAYKGICTNTFDIVIQDEQIDIEKEYTEFKQVKINLAETSSWKNTYLCI
jgi:branched-chain amino acid transport system substrate-binding protein